MINHYYWCYRNSNPTPKKTKQSYSGKRKTYYQNTSNLSEQETKKLLQQSFSLENMIMLSFKESKIPILKTNYWNREGYQGIQKKSQ
ncbi:hypothetical protein [Spiroplasma poulsonii]|uniref:hypothetical protein n=1 Tax=Spiroplasma poulsonii TaxID=2138 RepID=UPI001F4CB180|nr:hypothetical protein [Spiroplasma poulsonii]UNF62507.1 hypothetical protein MNU24_03345 [Spiroplasma poulsonii]